MVTSVVVQDADGNDQTVNTLPPLGQAVMADSIPVVFPSDAGAGVGALTLVPAGSTNGTALGTLPVGARGMRLYLAQTDVVTFAIESAQPTTAPSLTFTVQGSVTGPNWDENLNGQMLYITSTTGTPKFRWV